MSGTLFDLAPQTEPQRQYYFIENAAVLVKKREEAAGRPLSFHVTTFGCQMNAKDSEKMEGILTSVGLKPCDDEKEADVVLFNTCTIRDNANQKFYGHLGSLNGKNCKRDDRIVAVCGCMAQEKECVDKLLTSYKFVNIIFGTHNIYKLAELLCRCLEGESPVVDVWDKPRDIVEDIPAVRKYPFKCGVNIMYGCNNYCTYCIVPYVRGNERSRDAREIIKECEKLASEGVKEVMLLGQNVNSYGNGIEGSISFPKLLKEVEKVEGIERIRFMTSHPKDLSDELIEVIKNSGKICRHIHLPLQSGSSRILKAMNRRYDKEHYLELAEKIRREIPEASITTDIIVGFPGETTEDIDDTIDVIKKVGYEGAFTFIYSPRTGTPAATMEGRPTDEWIKREFDRVLNAVQEESRRTAGRFLGNVESVLVEEMNAQDKKLVTGRMGNNLMVHFPGDHSLIGRIVDVRLDEYRGFYYMGTMVKGIAYDDCHVVE
ncbi:MAG: tRNA (N6-isopentenyl adenosine(37)-C2)-methylthiotransferase MiaB [Lachnospiraceae bacterium]|nr:tRNA (N6-isopentenyl adenosine(37)-C2)-methylthiotransferase MiaB [Lachnospiraceae bacterium]